MTGYGLRIAGVAGVVIALMAATAPARPRNVLPAPESLAENTVAVVSHVRPRVGTIAKVEFQRALLQAAAAAGRRTAPGPAGDGYGRLSRIAMGELLDFAWIRGQAEEMGIGLRPGQVRAVVRRLIKQAFKDRAEYREFLIEAHYTSRDVHRRVEVQILGTRIQEAVAAGLATRAERQKAFAKFVREYRETWRSRTVCAAELAIDRCSNAVAAHPEQAWQLGAPTAAGPRSPRARFWLAPPAAPLRRRGLGRADGAAALGPRGAGWWGAGRRPARP